MATHTEQLELDTVYEDHGALIIDIESLRRIIRFLTERFSTLTFSGAIIRRPALSTTFSDINQIPTVDNPKDAAILGIVLVGKSEDKSVKCTLANYDTTLQVCGTGLATSDIDDLRLFFAQEIKNTRAFYWLPMVFIAWLYRGWKGRLLTYAIPVCLIVWLMWNIAVPFSGDTNSSPSTDIERMDRSLGYFYSQVWLWTFIALMFVLGMFINRLFPRVFFKIAEGIDRYTVIRAWRFMLLASVIVPLLRRYI